MTKASEFHKNGYNCGEAMIKAINEDLNLNIPVAIGSAFGGGMSVGSTCGSIASAVAIIGYVKGREESSEKNEARSYAQRLMKDLKEKYDTYICKELKQKGVSCSEIIDFTYNKLIEELK